jgi:hypothetical protein
MSTFHQNPSLRSAINTQAGSRYFPYRPAYPVDYKGNYYAAYGGEKDTKSDTKSGWAVGAEALTNIVASVFTTRAASNAADAQNATNIAIAEINAQASADANAASANMAALGNVGGMGGGTVLLIVSGVALLGGVSYFVFRKKKG